jgi:hypothetical protein
MSPAKQPVQSKRTVCVCLSVCIFNQVSSSIQRTACICLYVYVSGQVPSSIPRTACTYLLTMFPVKCQVQSQEQLAPISCFVFFGQMTSSTQRTTCTLLSIPGLSTLPMFIWIPSNTTGSIDSSCLSCIHNQILHNIHIFETLKAYFYVQKQCKC